MVTTNCSLENSCGCTHEGCSSSHQPSFFLQGKRPTCSLEQLFTGFVTWSKWLWAAQRGDSGEQRGVPLPISLSWTVALTPPAGDSAGGWPLATASISSNYLHVKRSTALKGTPIPGGKASCRIIWGLCCWLDCNLFLPTVHMSIISE